MASNDKISNMTVAVVGDILGSAGRIEMTKAFATVPVTLGLDFATLRTSMFAGSTGYTATDPITAGAASFTTLAASSTAAITGNLTVGASTFVVTAATGAVAITGLTTHGSADGSLLIRGSGFSEGGPVIAFVGDDDTGLWRSAANTLDFITEGTKRLTLTTAQATLALPLAITGALTGVTSIAISGAAVTQAAGVLSLGNTTQTTVGAAGGASALPATPTGYLKTYIGSTQFVIPYYAQA